MAAGISTEEFQRLQSQLLDLRAANYTLMEESNKFRNEAKNASSRLEMLEKEYQKAQRALEKSRKAKDVELLFAENDALQNKLISQEEQFREQNQALLQELAVLVAANEKLENAAKNSKEQATTTPQASEQECQCDLATEYYEKLLEEEKQRTQTIAAQLEGKEAEVSALTTSIRDTRESLSSEINSLKENIISLQAEVDRIPSLLALVEEGKVASSSATSEIEQLKETLQEREASFRDEIARLKEYHQAELDKQGALHAEEVKQYVIQVELAAAQRTEFEEESAKARQEREDALEDVRIAERKRITDTADLRRQLRGERKRADKLQERLRDFIAVGDVTNGSSSSAASNNHTKSATGAETSFVEPDNCSVSSWSLMSGQNEAANGNTPASPYPSTDSPSSGSEKNGSRSGERGEQQPDLTAENSRLVSRLATMQQEKWRLEERVLHLEETNAAMADEMVKRGKLIQHYCMEGRPSPIKNDHGGSSTSLSSNGEKLSVRRMVSLIRQIGGDMPDGDSDGQQRRIQRMLEETLTKNMHLQEDIERLSQEVVRLSQLAGSANLSTSIPLPADSAVMNSA